MKTKLFVKLFAGEFGFELMRWQGCIRHIAKDYDHVTVECKEGHEYLYEDFAHRIIRYRIIEAKKVSCSLFVGKSKPIDPIEKQNDFDRIVKPCIEICDMQMDQHFIPLGKIGSHQGYDLVIHARNDKRVVKYGDRNWPLSNWEKVSNHFANKRIASIGSKESAFYVPGTHDLRGIPLKSLSNVVCNSKLCVGPSSGPMHLTSLCKCKHIVWTIQGKKFMKAGVRRAAETSRTRYESSWNPLKTPAIVIDEYGWCPKPNVVIEEIKKCLA